jgi:valyl-tRNA synthetase
VKGWEVDEKLDGKNNKTAIEWFDARFNAALAEIEDHYKKYRLSDALMSVYKLIWDDFCSWYLEMIKPGFEQPIDKVTYETTLNIFEKLMKLVHPFMPFITEEIWHEIKERKEKDCIIIAAWPKLQPVNENIISEGEIIIEVVSNIRNIRNAKQIVKHVPLDLIIKTANKQVYSKFENIIKKLAAIGNITFNAPDTDGSAGFVVKSDEFFIPLKGEIDPAKEKENMEKELEYTKGFLLSVEKKLSNERFVSGAPAKVLDIEKQKKADAEAKIKALEKSLSQLNS